jgi:hypothetical protein
MPCTTRFSLLKPVVLPAYQDLREPAQVDAVHVRGHQAHGQQLAPVYVEPGGLHVDHHEARIVDAGVRVGLGQRAPPADPGLEVRVDVRRGLKQCVQEAHSW